MSTHVSGFQLFFRFFASSVLAIFASSSIMVKHLMVKEEEGGKVVDNVGNTAYAHYLSSSSRSDCYGQLGQTLISP